MKLNMMLYAVASLIPLVVLNLWMHNHLIYDISKITFLLATLLIVFSIDLLLVYIRGQAYAKQMDYGETKVISPRCIKLLTTTVLYLKCLTLGILMLLAAGINIYVLFLLIGLVPVEVLSYKLLNKELVQRSRIVLQTRGWREISAVAEEIDYYDQSEVHRIMGQLKPGSERNSLAANVNKVISSRLLCFINTLARTVVFVLAIYDLIINLNPFTLVFSVVLLPFFFSTLNIIMNGNISKRDLYNSIHFVDEMKNKLSPKAN